MNVVVLVPSGRHSPDALSGLAEADGVTVVCWERPDLSPRDGWLTVHESARSARLVAALSRTLPGRMLVRALPLDTGARFWRASAGVAEIERRVRDADVIIAVERDAGFAAWKWLQRVRRAGSAPLAVRGYAAAQARIGTL